MSAPQPEAAFVIAAQQQEIMALNDNKIYLLAILGQLQAEFRDAQAMWELERASLLAERE